MNVQCYEVKIFLLTFSSINIHQIVIINNICQLVQSLICPNTVFFVQ